MTDSRERETPGPFLFAGGGTGGHLFPGIAVASELRRRFSDVRVVFAGSEREIDRRILAESGFTSVPLPSESFATFRRHPWRFVANTFRAFRSAGALLRTERPACVVGLGGFASAPVVWAASRRRVPVVLLEQNTVPGRATRWLGSRASALCLSFEESLGRLPKSRRSRAVVTGNPVRAEIAALATTVPASTAPPTLLVLGGSQGSRSVNAAVLAAVRHLTEALRSWKIVHQTGPTQVDEAAAEYTRLGLVADVAAFFTDLPERYRTATIAVSRAGATTLAELACAGLPAVLIPYPQAADDHQRINAGVFERRGAAVVVEENSNGDSVAASLKTALTPLLTDESVRARAGAAMRSLARPEAACRAAELILEAARRSVTRFPASSSG